MDTIQVQTDDFNVQQHYDALRQCNHQAGAVVFFVGTVRDMNLDSQVQALELEHYPGMTEHSLQQIVAAARRRWPLLNVRLVHRVGKLSLGEQIVFVGVSSAHRQAAFEACHYIMDWLKTDAPFWKKEHTHEGPRWLEARADDQQAKDRWRDSHE
ncbi:molybdenum cofactor biosynthesis protein MoaE [Bacterioplanes sanyensis]|uniref:Molybdopterin synthase catalytic subunit n=1 Tax=Bacterioplanes sanyensis TaxID=1249553 RepID=A0A222FHB9_9GAMM|nr:molybdopterin synthase catalytic subunit MoaE [Bacterioplanes sanyensis]ASP38150.1 molybdenum cofactor biosynthesis protein MoaE [Bacterioplanes sanyensis]